MTPPSALLFVNQLNCGIVNEIIHESNVPSFESTKNPIYNVRFFIVIKNFKFRTIEIVFSF